MAAVLMAVVVVVGVRVVQCNRLGGSSLSGWSWLWEDTGSVFFISISCYHRVGEAKGEIDLGWGGGTGEISAWHLTDL